MKLHLGCGKRYIPGWFHVDLQEFEHVDVVHPVDRLPMVPDGSCDVVYACHVLEHFARADIPRVLAEWRRVLKPGGTLRLSVPDFYRWAQHYLERADDIDEVHGSIMGGQKDALDFHRTLFDAVSLGEALEGAGFRVSTIRRWDWRETEHADVDDWSQAYLPHMDKEHGTLMSLNMEATK